MNSQYEVATGLWIGSKRGDLLRERKVLISRMIKGDITVKNRILEINNELTAMLASAHFKRKEK